MLLPGHEAPLGPCAASTARRGSRKRQRPVVSSLLALSELRRLGRFLVPEVARFKRRTPRRVQTEPSFGIERPWSEVWSIDYVVDEYRRNYSALRPQRGAPTTVRDGCRKK